MFCMLKKKKIYPANSNREKQVVLLMIPNEKGWHYLAAKNAALLKGITSKHRGDFCCLNWIHFLYNRKQT